MDDFFTISHAAREARVAEDTARLDLKRGRLIASARTAGGTSLFTRADLDAWIERRRTPATSRPSPEAA